MKKFNEEITLFRVKRSSTLVCYQVTPKKIWYRGNYLILCKNVPEFLFVKRSYQRKSDTVDKNWVFPARKKLVIALYEKLKLMESVVLIICRFLENF